MTTRRFPAPWRADNEAEPLQAKVLTADEARQIAMNVAKLLGLLKREE
jgi:hypothetical protein